MVIRDLAFDGIDPYIRYPHLFDVDKEFHMHRIAAYDYRLMYIYEGSGTMIIDSVEYEASKGNLFLWRPGIVYDMFPADGSCLSIIGINFDFTHTKSSFSYPIPPEDEQIFEKSKITEIINFSNPDCFNRTIFLRNMQHIENTLFEIINEYTIRKRFYISKIRGYFLLLIGDIARYMTLTGNDNEGGTDHKVDLILKYIREHYAESLTNKKIGEYFSFHPVYINRLMVKYTGTSLHQYIINYRISTAINMLQNSNKSVTEVAFKTGFKDINYFSKYFKKTVGLSPTNYITASRQIKQ